VSTTVTGSFTACSDGGNVAVAKETQKQKCQELGMNVVKFEAYFVALYSCTRVMNAKPDKYKNGRVVSFVDQCSRTFDDFIESQKGFKGFKTDKKKRKDKKYKEFYEGKIEIIAIE
jgi:hypothetical protein